MVASNNAKRLDQLAGSNQCECTHKTAVVATFKHLADSTTLEMVNKALREE